MIIWIRDEFDTARMEVIIKWIDVSLEKLISFDPNDLSETSDLHDLNIKHKYIEWSRLNSQS